MTSEMDLAAALGIPRERLKELRKNTLARGVEWEKDGGQILYTEAGVKKLRKALNLPADVKTAQDRAGEALVKKAGADTSTGVIATPGVDGAGVAKESLQDLRIDYLFPNPTWVMCWSVAGVRVQCRVRNSARLRPGMILRGCAGPDEKGRFSFQGRCW